MMKLFVLLLTAIISFTSVATAEPWRVYDNAGLLTEEETAEIEQAIFEYQKNTNFDFAFLSTDDFLGEDILSFAHYFYDEMDFGIGKHASGILFYIDMKHRTPCISIRGDMVDILGNKFDAAFDACHPLLVSGLYKDVVLKMLEAARTAVEEYNEKGAE